MAVSLDIDGYPVNAFREQRGGNWVIWIQTPDDRHAFVNAPKYPQAAEKAATFIQQDIAKSQGLGIAQRKEE